MLVRFNITKNDKKRKVCWTALVGAVQEYRMQMENLLIPVIVDDFIGTVEIRFGWVMVLKGEIKKLKEFVNKVELSDTNNYKNSLIESVVGLKGLSLMGETLKSSRIPLLMAMI